MTLRSMTVTPTREARGELLDAIPHRTLISPVKNKKGGRGSWGEGGGRVGGGIERRDRKGRGLT